MKLEEVKTWTEQGHDIKASGDEDKIKAELFKDFKINDDINLTEKVLLNIQIVNLILIRDYLGFSL